MPSFAITQNTTAPSLEVTLTDALGPVPLVAAVGVTFDMRTADGVTIRINGQPATIVNASTGAVRYDWQAGDTALTGTYHGKFTVTWSSGKTTAFPTDLSGTNNFIVITIVDDAKALG